jgi:hypothetical protein
MSLNKLSVFTLPAALNPVHSFGTCAFGILGSSEPLGSAEEAPPVRAGIGEGAGAGACTLAGANRLGRSVVGTDDLAKGLDRSDVDTDCGAAAFENSAGVDWGLKPPNVDDGLKASLELVSGLGGCENSPDEVLGCAALKRPALGSSKLLNMFEDDDGPASDAVVPKFGEKTGAGCMGCDASDVLVNPDGVAAVAGLANEANRLGFGVSDGALGVGCGALMLLNKEGFGVEAFSSGSLIAPNGLPAGVFSCA